MTLKKCLIIDDEQNIRLTLSGVLEDEKFVVETASNGLIGLDKVRSFRPDVVFLDIWMDGDDGISVLEKIKKMDPEIDVIIMSGHGSVETAVKSIKLGAFDFLEKPLHFDKVLVLLEHVFAFRKLRDENRSLKEALHDEEPLIGNSPALRRLRSLISVTAPSNGWVLIQGENGTGKELVARALHRSSPRASNRFVAVNCAAIPDELIESELFGHEKGSFTGAFERKIGRFEQADFGTLFLDEIGDMALKMQSKVLRVLQDGIIQRVGGSSPIELNIRVIAATNKDLMKSIERGEFREDLFYRLNVIPIRVPPLRERTEDIPALVEHFIHRYSGGRTRKIHSATMKALKAYPWPGNVRELKNWVERACILSPSDTIENTEFEGPLFSAEEEDFNEDTLRSARAAFEKQFIVRMLNENGGNISKTAQRIGLERSHLHKKMKTYGIETAGN